MGISKHIMNIKIKKSYDDPRMLSQKRRKEDEF